MLKLRRGRIALQCVILVGDAKGQCAGHRPLIYLWPTAC